VPATDRDAASPQFARFAEIGSPPGEALAAQPHNEQIGHKMGMPAFSDDGGERSAVSRASAPRCLVMRSALDHAPHRQVQVVNRPRSLNAGVGSSLRRPATAKALSVYLQEPTYLRTAGPAISCLGAFQTPAARVCGGLVTAGVRKPAQKPTSRHCTNKKPFVQGKEQKTNPSNLTVSVKELGNGVQPHSWWARDVSAPGSL